jgi:membrane associated rhomboid family serine protease
MRPTPQDIRTDIVSCEQSMKNRTCYYDDVLKDMCFSFMYPHQLWRMITANLLHMDWLHLLSNLLGQLIQGIPLECKYGSVSVAIIYWLSTLGANLSFMIIHRGKCKLNSYSFGMSGDLSNNYVEKIERCLCVSSLLSSI